MPIICTLDLETTGLSFEDDQITEIAYVIKEWGARKPLCIRHFYLESSVKVNEFIEGLTGITDDLLEKAGKDPTSTLLTLMSDLSEFGAEYILAQNGAGFDKPMLTSKCNELAVYMNDLPWIDSQHDIEWPERFKSKSLTFLACELGFLNPFPHDALSDVLTTIKVVELAEKEGITSIDEMISDSKIPWVYVQINADFHTKETAKQLRYRWEKIDDVYCAKGWINKFKENKLPQAKQDAEAVGLKIRRINTDE